MMLKEDFVDTYHNLTYKGVAALRWVDAYCSHATFVLKTDDDIFVNMFSLVRFLKKMTREAPRPNGLLMCCVWDGMPVQRSGKWKVCFYHAHIDLYKLESHNRRSSSRNLHGIVRWLNVCKQCSVTI